MLSSDYLCKPHNHAVHDALFVSMVCAVTIPQDRATDAICSDLGMHVHEIDSQRVELGFKSPLSLVKS